MTHFPVVTYPGVDDDSTPFFTIEVRCTCGALITRRVMDARESDGSEALPDAEAFERHCLEYAKAFRKSS